MAGLEDLSPAELQAYRLGKLLLDNPEVRRDAQRLAKKANPQLNIPEIEIEDQIAASERRAKEREADLEKQLLEERVERRRKDQQRKVEKAGYSLEEIEKIILDFGVTGNATEDAYDRAMKIADKMRQTADPTPADLRGGNAVGAPVEMRPGKDWSNLSNSSLRKRSAQIASEIINDSIRARRAAR